MAVYIPLLICAAIILAVTVWIALPWLKSTTHRDKAVASVLVVFFLSVALYLSVGSPFQVNEIAQQKQEHTDLLAQLTKLEKETASEAGAEHYAALGAAYIQTEQYAKAATALKEAVKHSEGQPELILMYGKAQMMAADGQITEGARQAFEIAAKLMPDNPDPAFMLALERMQAGDKEGARERMRALLPMLPEGIPLRRMIEQQLKEE
ncbi:MAG: hypothetical protein FJX23_04410 [Alphaproteobacteria bacterium]|nr:hypothetical protein [Alphaproteobacteria bacterium]